MTGVYTQLDRTTRAAPPGCIYRARSRWLGTPADWSRKSSAGQPLLERVEGGDLQRTEPGQDGQEIKICRWCGMCRKIGHVSSLHRTTANILRGWFWVDLTITNPFELISWLHKCVLELIGSTLSKRIINEKQARSGERATGFGRKLKTDAHLCADGADYNALLQISKRARVHEDLGRNSGLVLQLPIHLTL
jgi:hypothetical protein